MEAINIVWDVDSDEDLMLLPNKVEIPDGMRDEDEISDYITEATGFCHKGFELKKTYYYDVVASICNEVCRIDSHLVFGGFKTEEEAIGYINECDVSEEDYYKYCKDNETAYIEIEVRDDSASIITVITVD